MRIPQYQSQVSAPNAPQFNQIADVRDNSLATLADGLEQVYKVKLAEQEEAKKTAFFQADTSIKMEITKAKFDLMESIKNGGSYADAEKRYQKAHDEAIRKYSGAFAQDETGNTMARMSSEYQADGLQNLLSIRDAVTSRRRSDTAASANLRSEQLSRQLAEADSPEQANAIREQIISLHARATVAMGDSPDAGRLRATKAIQNAEADRLTLFAQNNAKNPQAVLDEVEKSKDLLDIDTYISMRGSAMNEIEKVATVDSVYSYMRDPATNAPPKQESVDMFYESELRGKMEAGEISLPEYEAGIISTSAMLNKVPTQIRNQVATYYAMEPSSMNEADLQTAASLSRIVSGISEKASRISPSDLPKEDIAKANLITRRMNAGVDVSTALSNMKTAMDSPESQKIYSQSMNEARAIVMQKKVNDTLYDINIPKYASTDFMDAFAEQRMLGASTSEAKEAAEKFIKDTYKEFNGLKIKDAVTRYSVFDEESWVSQATNAFTQINGQPPAQGQKLAVYADAKTKRQIANGQTPEFLVAIYQDGQYPYQLLDPKTGKPITLKENKEIMTIEKQTVFSKGAGLKTVRIGEQKYNAD